MVVFLNSALGVDFSSLHKILRTLYEKMMPLCSDVASFAAALAALGALFYIGYRVWGSLARAEPLDVFGLLRPFTIGLCILFFQPVVIGSLNGILSPLVVGTNRMLQEQVMDMKELQKKKDRLKWESEISRMTLGYIEPNEVYDKELQALGLQVKAQSVLDVMYEIHNSLNIKSIMLRILRWILELIFASAALILDTLRTFFLVILSICGPLAFAFSVFDGFQASLTYWLSRYITIYLWLPIADLLSTMLAKIQVISLDRDIELIESHAFLPDTANSVYVIFLAIGIVGYFCVPTVASWIVQSTGAGGYGRKVTGVAMTAVQVGSAVAGASTGSVSGALVGNSKH